jgi:hypothetical protein
MLAVIVGDHPRNGRPEPSDDDLIAQLRADLTEERARTLRLAGYIDEVLGEAVPDVEAISGWEAEDFWGYWLKEAEEDLMDDDRSRRAFWKREPIPVMGPPAPERPTTEAPC